MSSPAWFARPDARHWTCDPPPGAVRAFHESLPDHAATPLVDLPDLAAELDVGTVVVKDESSRFGLPSFKVLGASWAIADVVATRAGLSPDALTWDRVRAVAHDHPVHLVTATDGNHGRAVARLASDLDLPATILAPSTVPAGAISAIEREGARVEVLDVDYDTTVGRAADLARDLPDGALVQDTAWEGYTRVPARIVEGYATMLEEVDDQLAARGLPAPGLLVVPVGVGSLAQAVVTHARSRGPGTRAPAVLAVEPTSAACVLASLRKDERTTVATQDTVMAGLNCGTPSALGWPVLHAGLDAACTVGDDQARAASDDLGDHGVSSGPSGAATLAGARQVLAGPGAPGRRDTLGLRPDDVVVLLSTEGTAATAS
ncbi:diaminopropionate ammonia-lyase [Salsipaludibacter albus]|uniref:diaminopropionate ammonia-lyase n=1 Tax=Salsipaludibacter albus TaxID=2849650 RepID=UPI001EE47028|nr:diaminopropionate ammonia-lyase [Salsipaludibacter albus]MBY5161506.1 diaminopropionate ammonia-lyase [Salsipaludibacter albus]